MNLYRLLQQRVEAGRPVRVGLIGAGKFGSMFLSQVPTIPGLEIALIADLDPERARAACHKVGWDAAHIARTRFVSSGAELCADAAIEVVVEATGIPAAGIAHARAAIAAGKHIVMVNVEADVLAGPLLAEEARTKGVVYSMAYGDQPALTCELVDWARACGFEVVAAGKGTRYHPTFHQSTPDTVWENFGLSPEKAARGGMNPKMFNSFVDGTKSGIEMTAVCNATGLVPQSEGLGFPPATRFELADVCKPRAAGGTLEREGVTEVISSVYRDGRDVPHHLALGTYVVFEGESEYARRCFSEYHLLPDQSGRYAALYRPIHMIGLELGISVASAALRGEPTGAPVAFRSDVVATAKRALKQGEVLDGEGGFCVWGRQTPAARSLEQGFLPLGLAQKVKLRRDVAQGEMLKWTDVDYDPHDAAVKIRREMEAAFGRPIAAAS